MTDFRALCADLADWIRRLTRHYIQDPDVLIRAYAALDQSDPQPPADGGVREAVEWLGVISEQFRLADLNDQAVQTDRAADLLERLADGPAVPEDKEPASVTTEPNDQELYDLADQLNGEPVASMRAALARWGRPVPQIISLPTDQEIERWCDKCANKTRGGNGEDYWVYDIAFDDVKQIIHGALARWGRPTLQPVPVSERLPEAGDCSDSLCWQWQPDINGHCPLGRWELQHCNWLWDPDGSATYWLPAHALPLPSKEPING